MSKTPNASGPAFSLDRPAKAGVITIISFHLAVWVAEAALWTRPEIHRVAIPKLNGRVALDITTQATVLRTTFINQGFYNLFLALAGIIGLALLRRGHGAAAKTLILYMSASAIAAGVVLALSTSAYGGALLQIAPAAFVVARLTMTPRSAKLSSPNAT